MSNSRFGGIVSIHSDPQNPLGLFSTGKTITDPSRTPVVEERRGNQMRRSLLARTNAKLTPGT